MEENLPLPSLRKAKIYCALYNSPLTPLFENLQYSIIELIICSFKGHLLFAIRYSLDQLKDPFKCTLQW
jgi:hypothetical protein